MLYFDETVSYFTEQDGALSRALLTSASWREQQLIALDAGAVSAERVVTMRVRASGAPAGFAPKTGAYLVRGDVTADTLDALRALPHVRIIAVRDNGRGQTAHWAVSAV